MAHSFLWTKKWKKKPQEYKTTISISRTVLPIGVSNLNGERAGAVAWIKIPFCFSGKMLVTCVSEISCRESMITNNWISNGWLEYKIRPLVRREMEKKEAQRQKKTNDPVVNGADILCTHTHSGSSREIHKHHYHHHRNCCHPSGGNRGRRRDRENEWPQSSEEKRMAHCSK